MTARRDWFFLYRPSLPSARAQSVQVVHAAHALASRGHRVELWAEGEGDPQTALDHFGLAPVPGLSLCLMPYGRTAASIRHRVALLAWVARTAGQGIVLARELRHADAAARWLPGKVRLVFEAHDVASEEDRATEARVLRACCGLVCNAPGTLSLLQERHLDLPRAQVIHNAAREGRVAPRPDAVGVGVVGSVRPYKDPVTVARAAAVSGQHVTWVGADGPLDAPIRSEPPVPSRDVPERLSRFRTLLLPLSPGAFGEKLTSPLKLWDALASGVPLVAADTQAVALAAPGAYLPYRPGDAASLAEALLRADRDEAARAQALLAARALSRTWDQRAAEFEAFVEGALAARGPLT